MTVGRAPAIGVLFVAIGASALIAGDFSSYRGLQFGMDLAAASTQVGAKPGETLLVHQRPSRIQEIRWQPNPSYLRDPVKADPVKEALLCFLDGKLFRIEVTYDRYKIQGMTADDLVEAISTTYGVAARPTAEIAYHSDYAEVAAVLARWQDSDYSSDLVRTGDHSSFVLVLYSKRLDTLAQTAISEAVKLEAQEAPQREEARQRKLDEDERLVLEKARLANKPNFRP